MSTDSTLSGAPVLYDIPHRGLRWALGHILHVTGTTDFDDAESVSFLAALLAELSELTEQHMRHEERFLHAALRERGSVVYLTLEEEHAEHRSQLACLKQHLQAVARAEQPTLRGRDFNLALSRFVAESLEHMDHEESNAQSVFEQLFTTQELSQLHDELVRSIPPHEMAAFLKIILPGMHHKDRVAFLSGPRQGMPAELFQGMLRGSLGYLSAPERERLLSWADAA